MITGVRILEPYEPSPDDLRRAREMAVTGCPRRYCWWWRSARFDWHLTTTQGCSFLTAPKHKDWKHPHTPCQRADSASTIDHHEPRDPDLLHDGFAIDRFIPRK